MLDYPAEIRPRLPLPRYKANVKQRELVVLLVILWLLLLAPFILYVSTPFLFFEEGREEEVCTSAESFGIGSFISPGSYLLPRLWPKVNFSSLTCNIKK